jgi:Fe-S-cluster-containing hydrogenase component 2
MTLIEKNRKIDILYSLQCVKCGKCSRICTNTFDRVHYEFLCKEKKRSIFEIAKESETGTIENCENFREFDQKKDGTSLILGDNWRKGMNFYHSSEIKWKI